MPRTPTKKDSKPKINSGKQANASGQMLETYVLWFFVRLGFEVLDYPTYVQLRALGELPAKTLVKDIPYRSIYGNTCTTEFLIHVRDANPGTLFGWVFGRGDFICRIECKRQVSKGSVDEKYASVIENAFHAFPERNSLLIHDIPGAKRGVVPYLNRASRRRRAFSFKRFVPMDVQGFENWAVSSFANPQSQNLASRLSSARVRCEEILDVCGIQAVTKALHSKIIRCFEALFVNSPDIKDYERAEK